MDEPIPSSPDLVGDPSRRRFLASTGAATAGVAVAPLVAANGAPAADARPAAPAAGRDRGISEKADDLAPETRTDTGQALTTNQGLKISDDQNSLKAGVRGPVLLEDQLLREKLTAFDHERIPERVVHARGAAAHGHFQVYEPLSRLTRAHFLNDPI